MGRRVFRNNYKGHRDKTKVGGYKQEKEVDLAGMGESGGKKIQTTVIEQ